MNKRLEKQKVYFTYEQQIEKLRNDGLIIKDEKRAKARLKWEGYFNFAVGYNRLFKDGNRTYEEGTTFEHVEALFDFDKKLRGIIYEYAQNVECNLKALISDEVSKNYGVNEREYLSEASFSSDPEDLPRVRWMIGTCKSTLKDCCRENSGSYREYIAYYKKRYGHVPFWALIRALSFGNVSKFLCLMKREDGQRIAKEYGVSYSSLCNMMEVFVCFRNIAAHGERAYCAHLNTVALTKELSVFAPLELPRNERGDRKYGNNDFMAFLICAKYLLPRLEFEECLERVVVQVDKLQNVLQPQAFERVMHETGLSGNWRRLGEMSI